MNTTPLKIGKYTKQAVLQAKETLNVDTFARALALGELSSQGVDINLKELRPSKIVKWQPIFTIISAVDCTTILRQQLDTIFNPSKDKPVYQQVKQVSLEELNKEFYNANLCFRC